MKLFLIAIGIFAATHYGQGSPAAADDRNDDSSACRLSEFFVGGMEKYNELSCDDYMLEGDDKFTEPVSRAWLRVFYQRV